AGFKFANAVLRRATREARAILDATADDSPAGVAIRHSHPQWIVELWWEALGREETIALCDAGNRPAEDAVRVNTLVDPRVEIPGARAASRLPVALGPTARGGIEAAEG